MICRTQLTHPFQLVDAGPLTDRLTAIRAGDELAWLDLYEELSPQLYALLAGLGHTSPLAAVVAVFDQVVATSVSTTFVALWGELERAAADAARQPVAA